MLAISCCACPSSIGRGAETTITRRHVLVASSSAALSSLPWPAAARKGLLDSSHIYAVRVDSSGRALPSTNEIDAAKLMRTLGSKRAIFLGEHHPALRDHVLQAALLQRLCATRSSQRPLAVGLEAVQQQFQSVLDDYVAKRIDEQQLFTRTEWEKRWYWSFDAYLPIFRVCREHGVNLVALDVDSEDKSKVELGGLDSLGPAAMRQYIPDIDGFTRFGSTHAFDEYVAYTLQPPFKLMKKVGQRLPMSTNVESDMAFTTFVARQCLRDEAMATATVAWLAQNPGGLILGLVGVNHVKFACGVPARTARMLPGGLDGVSSVLMNPTPASTYVNPSNLRVCDRTAVRHEACVRNDIEVQNYVLQVPYARDTPTSPSSLAASGKASARTDQDEATEVMQAKKGSSVLSLSDYLIFSPA